MSKSIYTHKHHIIPRHAGGSDDPSNLVELTVEEHALAHKKLYEKYGRWQDELAWLGLSGRIGKEEVIRQALIEGGRISGKLSRPHTEESKRKIGLASKGRQSTLGMKMSDETKRKISEAKTGRKMTPRSLEHRQKLSEANKGKFSPVSDEARENMSKAQRGRKHSEATKQKMSESAKLRELKNKE